MTADRTFTMYGASDDLLEFEGGIDAEIDCYDADPMPVLVNGVHMFTVAFTREGNWHIDIIEVPDGFTVVEYVPALGYDHFVNNKPRHPEPHGDKPSYSDIVTVTGPVEQVDVYGQTLTD